MLKKKKILLAISGGIAAYKSIDLASKLIKQKAIVKVILTKNALKFITPLSIKSIVHNDVEVSLFDEDNVIKHIELADWADIIVIAPATANIIGKIANGIADDLLTTTLMAVTKPVLIVPAMNIHMYENPILQNNIQKLKGLNYYFMEPEFGVLACGYEGKGRFPDVTEIICNISTFLYYKTELSGKKILVTAGATRQKIDPMRYLTNFSSGKMGINIARNAAIRGADVTLLHGVTSEKIPDYLTSKLSTSAEEMYNDCFENFENFNVIIMCAAVSDYTPEKVLRNKLKKSENLNLKLIRTNDILLEMGKRKKAKQILIGFAAESENIIENAKIKLNKKNLDFIIANNLEVSGKDETEITILSKTVNQKYRGDKFYCAHKILDILLDEK
ncbi:MAG: bifunctional phosphopantothenoylcysteine decarboxylase/phosphopantothenate--cysteine ligase CoaBC [Candidatus Cloacimonetes bacterium]|nr:bifunctional phosphopantothenoylcysteine decarboxylase/phosphopantothenate--cysteine ligase CoaBC [Candidatus Cloacimonadota bacterium]